MCLAVTQMTKKHERSQLQNNLGLFIACGVGMLAAQTAGTRLLGMDHVQSKKKQAEWQKWVSAGKSALRTDCHYLPILGAQAVFKNYMQRN
jgi:hypothetical protein